MSFLISVKSTESQNGYDYSMDFPEALIIDPNSKISLVNFYYERQDGVELDSDNSYLYVRIGSAEGELQLLNLGQNDAVLEPRKDGPELSAQQLANRIEDRFNQQFGGRGYTISCLYLPNTNQFQITNYFRKVRTEPTAPAKVIMTNGEAGLTFASDEIDVSGITNTTSNWFVSGTPLQTTGVPSRALGGSVFEIQINSAIGNGPNDNFGAGVVLGLAPSNKAGSLGSAGGAGAKAICNPANGIEQNTLCSISYFTRTAGNGFIQITEKDGVTLQPTEQTLLAGSKLQILLNGNADEASGVSIQYFFKNGANGKVQEIKPTQRTLTRNDWFGADLTPVFGTDTNTIGKIENIKQTIGGDLAKYIKYDWADASNPFIENGPTKFEANSSHVKGTDFIIRQLYDANSVKDLDSGVVSPLVPAGDSSSCDFTLHPNFFNNSLATQELYINVCNETQRLLNIANGQTLGTDSSDGLTTNGSGADRGNPKNPMLLQFQLKGSGELQVRNNQNDNTAGYTTIINLNTNTYKNNLLSCKLEVQAESNCGRLVFWNYTNKATTLSASHWFELPRMNATSSPNHIGGYSASGNNYRFHFNIAKWSATSTTDYWDNPSIGSITLNVESDVDAGTDGYIELTIPGEFFRDNDSLGAIIGFKKGDYPFAETGTIIKGEGTYDPHYKVSNPSRTLYLNCPTLNLRNVIGQKFSTTDTLASGPSGNLQGINRYLAKIPRYHDEAGGNTNTKGNTGPFFYNYFPYSIPLNNATELNMNDLHLTITTDDNQPATDVVYSEVLLSITNVESAGQGDNPKIGRPMVLPQSHGQQNVLQSHMNPSLA